MPLEPGQALSHYRLIERIGAGGVGIVWRAVSHPSIAGVHGLHADGDASSAPTVTSGGSSTGMILGAATRRAAGIDARER